MLLRMIAAMNKSGRIRHAIQSFNFIQVVLSLSHIPDINQLYQNYPSDLILISKIIIQKYIPMDGTRLGSDYNNGIALRRKKIQVTSTNKVQTHKKQQYLQTNPYFLNRNPSVPFLPRTPNTPGDMSNRDTLTETSSQKSGKIIRTNGLTKAQKPNLSNSRSIQKGNIQKVNGARVGPAFSSGFSSEDQIQLNYNSQQQYGLGIQSQNQSQNQNQNPKNGGYENHRIQQQNMLLKQQNARLRQQMTRMQRSHKQQVKSLKEQVDRIFKLTNLLEERIIQQDKEWEKFTKQSK